MERNSYIAISHMQRIGKKPVLAIMSADGKMERVILWTTSTERQGTFTKTKQLEGILQILF